MKPDWKSGLPIFTAGFTVERTGHNLQGESIYRRPTGQSGCFRRRPMVGDKQRYASGGSGSPLIANVYLHYCFDLWADVWPRKVVNGDVIIVRYADDLALGFQHRADAMRFLEDLEERLAKFGLDLHPEKIRLIEFGRYAARDVPIKSASTVTAYKGNQTR